MRKSGRIIEIERRFGKPIEKLLAEDYWDRGLTTRQIARRYGVDQPVIRKWMKMAGVKARDFSQAQFHRRGKIISVPSKSDLHKWYVRQRKSSPAIAKMVGVSSDAVREWLKNAEIRLRHGGEASGYIFQRPSVKDLRKWYIEEKRSAVWIGRNVGVSAVSVYKWLREAGVFVRGKPKPRITRPPTPNELRQMYGVEKESSATIAKKFGITETAVLGWLKKAGIKRRSHREKVFAHSKKDVRVPSEHELYDLYVRDRMTLHQIGREFNVSATAIARWLEDYDIPRRGSWYGRPLKRGKDGDFLRSEYEEVVCNWLAEHGIQHLYDVFIAGTKRRCDFKIGDLYIEIWGVTGDKTYARKKIEKMRYYDAQGLKRMDLFPEDFKTDGWKRKLASLLTHPNPANIQKTFRDFRDEF